LGIGEWFRVEPNTGFGFKVEGFGVEFFDEVASLGFRVQGSGFRV